MSLRQGASLLDLKEKYQRYYQDFEMFGQEVVARCVLDKDIANAVPKIVYTHKYRIKQWDSLEKKVLETNREIDSDNLFHQVSDIFGLRLVVLHPSQLVSIHDVIKKNIIEGRWRPRERPKAYEGDQRYVENFKSLGLEVEEKESYYTSLHYLVEQASDSNICVEIQVRTLFEEIWGEVEHFVRYKPLLNSQGSECSQAEAVDDEMRVLSYIISTGRAHLDLIFRSRQ